MSRHDNEFALHIDNLESKVAFQEDALHSLHLELIEHQKSIDKLQRQVLLLAEKLQQNPDQGILRAHEEPPPPHY